MVSRVRGTWFQRYWGTGYIVSHYPDLLRMQGHFMCISWSILGGTELDTQGVSKQYMLYKYNCSSQNSTGCVRPTRVIWQWRHCADNSKVVICVWQSNLAALVVIYWLGRRLGNSSHRVRWLCLLVNVSGGYTNEVIRSQRPGSN